MLIAVPGGNDGPGGVLVCSENFIVYKNHGHADKRCALPRRRDLPTEHGLLLVSSAVHRQRDLFFILVQSEFGDLYKVTLGYEEDQVSEVKVRYLDSVPVCSALCMTAGKCMSESRTHPWQKICHRPTRRRGQCWTEPARLAGPGSGCRR